MYLRYNEEEDQLRSSTRSAIKRSIDATVDEGRAAVGWRELINGGLIVAALPNNRGGGGWQAACLIAEELGRAAAVTPFAGSVGIVFQSLNHSRPRLLDSIVEGAARISPAVYGAHGEPGEDLPIAQEMPGQFILNGRTTFVQDADQCDSFLVHSRVSRADEDLILLVPSDAPGVSIDRRATSGGDTQWDVGLDRVLVDDSSVLSRGSDARSALLYGFAGARLLQAAYMVGQADKVSELAADHVRTRRQFGRPLSSFQAVQHSLADLLIARQGSRRLVQYISWLADASGIQPALCAEAKLHATRTVRMATRQAHELHGGLGAVDDHEVSIHHRRAVEVSLLFGSAYELRDTALVSLDHWPEL